MVEKIKQHELNPEKDYKKVIKKELSILEKQIGVEKVKAYKKDIEKFVYQSITNTLPSYLAKFNAKNFDKDKIKGFSKEEFSNYLKTLYMGLYQLIEAKGYDKLKEAYKDIKDVHWYEVDLFLADKANKLVEEVLGDGSWGEDLLKEIGNYSEKEIKQMEKKEFDMFSSQSWKETIILVAKEIPDSIKGILKFFADLPSAVLLLPRYLTYRSETLAGDEQAKLKYKILSEDNLVLGLINLIGPEGIEMLKKLAELIKSGTQGAVAMTVVTIFGLLAGGAGAVKLGAKFGKMEKLEAVAGKVEQVANKVDWTINTGGLNLAMRPAYIRLAGKLNTSEDVVLENAKLSDKERIDKAEEILGRKLTKEQKKALLKAHYVGSDRKGAGVYNYTMGELLKKDKILKEAGFTKQEREKLLKQGLAGKESKKVISTEEFYNNFVNGIEKNYPELKVYFEQVGDKERFVKYLKEHHEDRHKIYEKLYGKNYDKRQFIKEFVKDAVVYSRFDFLDANKNLIYEYSKLLGLLLENKGRSEIIAKTRILLEKLDKDIFLSSEDIQKSLKISANYINSNNFDLHEFELLIKNNLFTLLDSEFAKLYKQGKLNTGKWGELINFLKANGLKIDNEIYSYNEIKLIDLKNLRKLSKEKIKEFIDIKNKKLEEYIKNNSGKIGVQKDFYKEKNVNNKKEIEKANQENVIESKDQYLNDGLKYKEYIKNLEGYNKISLFSFIDNFKLETLGYFSKFKGANKLDIKQIYDIFDIFELELKDFKKVIDRIKKVNPNPDANYLVKYFKIYKSMSNEKYQIFLDVLKKDPSLIKNEEKLLNIFKYTYIPRIIESLKELNKEINYENILFYKKKYIDRSFKEREIEGYNQKGTISDYSEWIPNKDIDLKAISAKDFPILPSNISNKLSVGVSTAHRYKERVSVEYILGSADEGMISWVDRALGGNRDTRRYAELMLNKDPKMLESFYDDPISLIKIKGIDGNSIYIVTTNGNHRVGAAKIAQLPFVDAEVANYKPPKFIELKDDEIKDYQNRIDLGLIDGYIEGNKLVINKLAFDAALLRTDELKQFIEIYEKVFPDAFKDVKEKLQITKEKDNIKLDTQKNLSEKKNKKVYLLEDKLGKEIKNIIKMIKTKGYKDDAEYVANLDPVIVREFIKNYSEEDFDKLNKLIDNNIFLGFNILKEDVFNVIKSLSEKDIENLLLIKNYFKNTDLVSFYKDKTVNGSKNIDLFLQNKELLNKYCVSCISNGYLQDIPNIVEKFKLVDELKKLGIEINFQDHGFLHLLEDVIVVEKGYLSYITPETIEKLKILKSKEIDYQKLLPELFKYIDKLNIDEIKNIYLLSFFLDKELILQLFKDTVNNGGKKTEFLLKNNQYLYDILTSNGGEHIKGNNIDEVVNLVKSYKNLLKEDLGINEIIQIKNSYLKKALLKNYVHKLEKNDLKGIKFNSFESLEIIKTNFSIAYDLWEKNPKIFDIQNENILSIFNTIKYSKNPDYLKKRFESIFDEKFNRVLNEYSNDAYFEKNLDFLLSKIEESKNKSYIDTYFTLLDNMVDYYAGYYSHYKKLLNFADEPAVFEGLRKLISYGFLPAVNSLLRMFYNDPKLLKKRYLGNLEISENVYNILGSNLFNIENIAKKMRVNIEDLLYSIKKYLNY